MGATTSKVDGPLETLDAEQVHGVVAGFGTQFAGAADKMTCPPDKAPGSQLLVKVPSGQTIRATVPQRLGPGRSFTVVAPAAPVATQYAVLPPPTAPSVSLSSSASLDVSAAASGTSAAASGTAGVAKKFAKEVAKDYAWDQAKSCGKEVLASIVSSDSMADATGFLLGM